MYTIFLMSPSTTTLRSTVGVLAKLVFTVVKSYDMILCLCDLNCINIVYLHQNTTLACLLKYFLKDSIKTFKGKSCISFHTNDGKEFLTTLIKKKFLIENFKLVLEQSRIYF